MKKTLLAVLTAAMLIVGIALAGPAAGSNAYCTAGAPAPDVTFSKGKYKVAHSRATMVCRSGYMVGDGVQRAPYLPEIIVGMHFRAELQSRALPDGGWVTRSIDSGVREQEGTIELTLASRCVFATETEWRVSFPVVSASVYSGREINMPYAGRTVTLACG